MSSHNFAQEQKVAIAAVLKASLASQKVFGHLARQDSVTKSDKSPVTVADYTAQALVSALIFSHFPDYGLIGEEDSKDLRSTEQSALREKICELANEALGETSSCAPDQEPWSRVSKHLSEQEWLTAIDKGDADTAATGLTWALDPIDGTKGFLRGGQYAVCLALIKDGEPVLGVVGCPNLPVDYTSADAERGVIFVAVKGQGAFQRSFDSDRLLPIKMNTVTALDEATFCESVEAGHSDQNVNARIASILGIKKPSVRMDSQAKYCSISRGDGDIYLRLPTSATYEEKIWDHAAGCVLVAEAGGIVSDCHGKPVDFAQGRTLQNNKGIIAAERHVHAKVLRAVKEALSSS